MVAAVGESKVMDMDADASEMAFKGSVAIKNPISKEDLYSQGMKVLHDFFGIVNAEAFISMVKNEKYDYTEWCRKFYDKMTPEEYFADVKEFAKTHPYKGDASTIAKP